MVAQISVTYSNDMAYSVKLKAQISVTYSNDMAYSVCQSNYGMVKVAVCKL